MNWEDVLLDLGLSYVFTLLKKIPKTPELARKYKNVMLKIANAIFTAYPDDPDFKKLKK